MNKAHTGGSIWRQALIFEVLWRKCRNGVRVRSTSFRQLRVLAAGGLLAWRRWGRSDQAGSLPAPAVAACPSGN